MRSSWFMLCLVFAGCDQDPSILLQHPGSGSQQRDAHSVDVQEPVLLDAAPPDVPGVSVSDAGDAMVRDALPVSDMRALDTDAVIASDAASGLLCQENMAALPEAHRPVPPLGGVALGSLCVRCSFEEPRMAGGLVVLRNLFLDPEDETLQGEIRVRSVVPEDVVLPAPQEAVLGQVFGDPVIDGQPYRRFHDLAAFAVGPPVTLAWNRAELALFRADREGVWTSSPIPWAPLTMRTGALTAAGGQGGYAASLGPDPEIADWSAVRVHTVSLEGMPSAQPVFSAQLQSEEHFAVLGWRPFPDQPVVEQVEMSHTSRQGPILLVRYTTGPIEGAPFAGPARAFMTAGELVVEGGSFWSGLQKAAWSVEEDPVMGADVRLRSEPTGLFWVFRTQRSCAEMGEHGCLQERHAVVRLPVGEPGVWPTPPPVWEPVVSGYRMLDVAYGPEGILLLAVTDAPAGQRQLVLVRVSEGDGVEPDVLELASEAVDPCGYAWEWQEGVMELSVGTNGFTALAVLAFHDRAHALPAFSELRRFTGRLAPLGLDP